MTLPQPDPSEFRNQILKATPAQIRAYQQRFDPGLWAIDTARISLPKGAFSFDGRDFIRQVYRDLSEEIVVIKGAQMGFAVDPETEVLTRRGWLRHDQIRDDDWVLSYDAITETTRWSPIDHLYIYPDYAGPMVRIENLNIDAMVTPNHNWLVKHHTNPYGAKIRTTEDLRVSDTIPYRAQHSDFPETSPYSDEFVALVGWVLTEGNYTNVNHVTVAQNPGYEANLIRGTLTALGEPWTERLVNANGACLAFTFHGASAKRIRAEFPDKILTHQFLLSLTRAQSEILYDVMMMGDGSVSVPTLPIFYQRSKETTDAFATLCLLLGKSPKIVEREPRVVETTLNKSGFIRQNGTQREVHIRQQKSRVHVAKTRREVVSYRGLVWCLSTRDNTFVMRRNGKTVITGNSVLSIIRSLWAVTTFPLSVIYTFPTRGDVTTFTAARINPIIASSPYLRDRIQNFDSVGMKQFARVPREQQKKLAETGMPISFSTIYFNGAQNPKDATSVDADLLVHDEEDRSDPQTIEEYQSRLFASKYKWMFRLSTPTYPGAGIDRQWKRSDMRHWLIKCPSCNYEFEMDFPQNIEPASFLETPEGGAINGTPARYKCHRCNATITEDARQRGRWVAERPQVAVHGYSISQMSASWVPAIRILEQEFKATFKGAFWNLVMARPYQEGANAMTKDAILARQDVNVVGDVWDRMQDGSRGMPCTMGVDVGKYLDVVIGTMQNGKPRTIEFKRLSGDGKWDELNDLMRLYGVVNCVVDSQPEDHMAHVFANRWDGRVWRCRYSDGRVKEIKWDDTTHSVTVPRSEILTRSSLELLSDRILPRYDGSDEYDAYVSHHENSKKVPIFRGIETVDMEETVDRERMVAHYEWRETGPDHFFHAATYEMMARMGYRSMAGLPSVGLTTINRSKSGQKESINPGNPTLPLLLPSSTRRAKNKRGW